MIVGNRNMHQTIALEGTGALVRLLAVSEDEELVRQVLTIISAVATTSSVLPKLRARESRVCERMGT